MAANYAQMLSPYSDKGLVYNLTNTGILSLVFLRSPYRGGILFLTGRLGLPEVSHL